MACSFPVQTVIKAIESLAPLCAAAPWDHSGVQVLGRQQSISRMGVCLDPTPEQVAKILDDGADFVLAHHPLSMAPQYLDAPGPYYDVVSAVLPKGAWLYSAHTSLDANPTGPSGWLAEELGLNAPVILEQTFAAPATPGTPEQRFGFGLVGDFPEALPLQSLCTRVEALTRPGVMTISGPRPASIRRVAICGGSGSQLAPRALELGADVFITGDVKYHTALESNICLLDVGHFSLEEEMMRRAAKLLEAALPGLSITFFAGADPFSPACPV